MKLPEICIRRPVLTSMMNLALVIAGFVALFDLPVREVPDIDPPIVNVNTTFTGANARTVETEVTEVLEEAVNGIEGIKRLTSESREEVSSITIEFELWRDVDVAAQDVRDRVSRVRGNLPDDVEEPIIAKQEADARPILWVALYSDRYSTLELTNIGENILQDPLQTVKGVSSVILGGSKRYAVRIRLDPDRMAARNITVSDIESALNQQNVELPSGRVENLQREFTIRTLGQLKSPEDYNKLIIKREGRDLVRLEDIGHAEQGVEDERAVARYKSQPAMGLGIVKQSKANTIAVAQGIVEELEHLKTVIPQGVETFIAYDESVFVDAAIKEVWRTLGMAFFLVVLTIFAFLRSGRSTFVPALTIPVSLITTFALISYFGFSINILTMLALVLAIGLVVDDSIVVLENIYRHIEMGKKPLQAAYDAMDEISFAVIATTVALVAVFLPLAYQKSVTGLLFTEFAVTLCGAVVVSTFVALTLTPSVAGRILKPIEKDKQNAEPDNSFVARWTDRYINLLQRSLNHPWKVLFLTGLFVATSVFFLLNLESEFLPDEDKGRLFNLVIAPEGATAEYTDRMVAKMEAIVSEVPEVAGYFSAVALARQGPGKASEGLMFIRFKPDRDRSVQDILAGPQGLRARFFTEIEGAFALAILPKSVGRGFDQQFQLELKSNDLDALDAFAQDFVGRLRGSGLLDGIRTKFEFNKPELQIEINRERAGALGVSVREIARTLQVLFGGSDLSSFSKEGEQYDVIVQLDRGARLTPRDLDSIYLRNDQGQLVQLNNVVKYSETAGPNGIFHYNRMRSASIEGTPKSGHPLGTVIAQVEQMLAESMPPGFRYEWGGEAADLKDAAADTLFVLMLAIVTIYIVLAAQFESLVHPITVMVALPLAAVGALGSLWLLGQVDALGESLYGWAHYAPDPPAIAGILSAMVPRIPSMTINIFSQIGMVLLLGLVTKNSILLVEFANQEMGRGKSAADAMLSSARVRFRPILMTAFGTITGILPIAIGFGAGAESRRPMGVAAVGGMVTATALTFFVVPVVYILLDKFRRQSSDSQSDSGEASVSSSATAAALLFVLVLAPVDSQAQTQTTTASDSASQQFVITLPIAIQTALEQGADAQVASEQLARARAQTREARSYLLPQLTGTAEYEKTDKDLLDSFGDTQFGSDEAWNAEVELRQPIFAGGSAIAGLKRQRRLESAQEQQKDETDLDVILLVKRRFYAVLLARAEVEVQTQSVELLTEELNNEKAKYRTGEVSQFNVLRAEVALANSRTPLIRARNALTISYEDLKSVLGVPLDSPLRQGRTFVLEGELTYKDYSITLDDALASSVKRPRLQRLEHQVEAADQTITYERAEYFPSLDAFAKYGVEKSRFSDELDDTLDGWRAGLSLDWKIFDSFRTPARVEQSARDLAIARTNLRQARLDVEVEVQRAHSSLIEARQLVKASEKVHEQAEESLRLAQNRVQAGAATQLDILAAQVALTDARSNRVRALYDYNLAIAAVERAIGLKNLK
ncbi:MAG: efflux RND transporter permease subunit [Bdellovibrionales bacterium]|nr:efflux RND transporter permease subunit [Bdellovibrionales bacterium]